MLSLAEKFEALKNSVKSYSTPESLYFIPAAFFVALGLCILFAPNLVVGLLAGFSIFLGVIAAVLAWKFVSLKKKFDNVMKQLDGKVLVHSMHIEPDLSEDELYEIEEVTQVNKKVTYH